ncbi:MAG: hypothetical protein AAGA61_10185 [Pseudomonadota bacterium]
MTVDNQRPALLRLRVCLRSVALLVALLAAVHALAWLAAPRGLGFNPHPWYLAAPGDLQALLQSLGFPTTNLGVVSTFFLFLPGYIIVTVACWWLANRNRSDRNQAHASGQTSADAKPNDPDL